MRALLRAALLTAPPLLMPVPSGLWPANVRVEPTASCASTAADNGWDEAYRKYRDAGQKFKDGELELALGILEEAVASFPEATAGQLGFLGLRLVEYRRRAGQNLIALMDVDRFLQGLDPARDYDRRVQCALFNGKARSHLALGQLDQASRAVARMVESYAGLKVQYARADPEAWRGFEIRVLLHYSRGEHSLVEKVVEEAMGHEQIWIKVPERRAHLLQLQALSRFESTAKGSAAWDGVLIGFEKFCLDAAVPPAQRYLPLVKLAEHHVGSGQFEASQLILEKAVEIEEEGTARLGPKQVGYRMAVALSLELARGADSERLISCATPLEAAVEGMLTEMQHRELTPGGYGPFHFGEGKAMLSTLMEFEIRLGLGSPKASDRQAAVERAFDLYLASQEGGTLTRMLGGAETSLEGLRAALIQGEEQNAILAYFPTSTKTHAFLISSDAIQHFSCAPFPDVLAAMSSLNRFLGPPTWTDPGLMEIRRTEQRKESQNLGEALLPSALQDALSQTKSLTICHGGFLDGLPFAALPLEKGGRLGVACSITYAPSLRIGQTLAERQASRAHEVGKGMKALSVFFSPKVHGEGLAGLKGTQAISIDETFWEDLRGIYREDSMQVVQGEQSTAEKLRSAMPQSVVTQVIAHGGMNTTREHLAMIGLAPSPSSPDGMLTPDGLASSKSSPLMILTVCGAGRGVTRMGDVQARSFSGTLFLGGANCVLESAHEIDVEVALRLSKALHQTLVQGGTPADAVRSFFGGLQDEERFDDLFYHSLIRVVGAGQVPVFSDSLGE